MLQLILDFRKIDLLLVEKFEQMCTVIFTASLTIYHIFF